jgi:hypothetical protein
MVMEKPLPWGGFHASPVTQHHSGYLCRDDAEMADMRFVPACYPLERIVIKLWLKGLECSDLV